MASAMGQAAEPGKPSAAVDLLCQIVGELRALNERVQGILARQEMARHRQEEAVERLAPAQVDAFLLLWNRCCAPLPTVKGAGPTRRRKIAKALRLEANLERWEQAILALAASSWHRGENPNGVKYGTIDFLLRAGNGEAWLEKGEEHHRRVKQTAATTRKQVWCQRPGCDAEALFGPDTKNPDLAEEALCGEHFEAIVGVGA